MVKIKQLNSTDVDFQSNLDNLLAFESAQDDTIDATVAKILADIRTRKNAALIEYTNRFDRLSVNTAQELELTHEDLQQALAALPIEQRTALQQAAERIRSYHEKQLSASWQYYDSHSLLGQKITPLDRVGLYVPGGKASYPSSLLMNAIPAKVAGVKELIMVVPTPNGERNTMVLAAAAISQVDRVFTIGGAQAIGALAYGTETIPQVDKIVGPGNAYVAAAKRRVCGIVGIDMVAGPSEILVICDGKTNPDWIAMDWFSQAENEEMAQSILLCPDSDFLQQVLQSIERLLPEMPRKGLPTRTTCGAAACRASAPSPPQTRPSTRACAPTSGPPICATWWSSRPPAVKPPWSAPSPSGSASRGLWRMACSPASKAPHASCPAPRPSRPAATPCRNGTPLARNLQTALADLPLRADRLNAFLDDVDKARNQPLLTPETLHGSTLALAVDSLLLERPQGWNMLIPLRTPHGDAPFQSARVEAALSGSDALFVDIFGESNNLYRTYLDEAILLSLAGIVAIIVLMGVVLREPMRLLRVMAPVVTAELIVMAGLVATGRTLTLLHLVGSVRATPNGIEHIYRALRDA